MGNDHPRSRDKPRHHSHDLPLIHTIPQDRWTPDTMSSLGFDHSQQSLVKLLKVHTWPFPKLIVSKQCVDGRKDRLCSFYWESENGKKKKFLGATEGAKVITLNSTALVVQVVKKRSISLLVVNWRQGKLLGTYSFACMKEPCYQECFLSPDGSMMLCRQDILLRRCLHHLTTVDPFIRVIQVKDGQCKRLFVIEDYLAMNILGSGISFDPCYPQGRVAIFSSTRQSVALRSNADEGNRLVIHDLKQGLIVAEGRSNIDDPIHHMTHSPDGSTVAVVCVDVTLSPTVKLYLASIVLYSTDTLAKTHYIPLFNELCKQSMLSMYPVFSRNGRLLAQFAGEQSRVVEVYGV